MERVDDEAPSVGMAGTGEGDGGDLGEGVDIASLPVVGLL